MYHKNKLLGSFLLFLLLHFSTSTDTITSNQSIKDGDILVSNGKNFALGFFSPGSSSKRYVGIWYYKVTEQTVVWVANRDSPINDTSGVLAIDQTGNLVILHVRGQNIPLWSTNASALSATNNCSAQLLDSGNLVLFQGGSKRDVSWQSFDYPTNTALPYMKLGVDRRTGLNRFLTSWKSSDDPGTGEYSYKMNLSGFPELFLNKGSDRIWRTGPWNGLRWSGIPQMTSNFILNASYVDDGDEVSIMYTIRNASIVSRMVVNESGVLERATWHEGGRGWVGFWSAPNDQCDFYNSCGAYGNCDANDTREFDCKCLPGFEPKSPHDWYLRDGSGGCTRKRGGHVCGEGEGFVKVARANVPDTSTAHVEKSLGLKACEELCLRNCTCKGYASADIRGGGSGCVTWYGDLVDTRVFSNVGQDLYIRVDAVELAQYSKSKKAHDNKRMAAIIAVSVAVTLFLAIFLAIWLVMKRRKGRRRSGDLLFSPASLQDSPRGKELDESATSSDVSFFNLSTIVVATDNFSSDNKLGQGGFGSVYKGRLHNGQEIAVKRLSKKSGQGTEEFKNEVTLIAKLQHRNLVKLLGCCIQKEEKMLVYEYLPNKGLDSFIFDKTTGADWKKRFDIVLGIARGMIYLHQDSRLRIIHRDLKASNVLLDAAMNPKISDFGMARMFGGDQIEANTERVVGTYGYMSPEYAMGGIFSVKSDVFSFGVLLLEIISGTKNSSYSEENSVNLIGHVWGLWREGKGLDIVDSSLGDSYSDDEVLRCIHIGLLCVQENASDRPTMSTVAFMLCNETVLPPPKQPAFIFRTKRGPALDSSSASVGANSVNEVTITEVAAR